MKKIIAPLLLLTIAMNTFCQQIDSSLTKTDYLRKSKNQKIAAYVFLGSGAVLVVGAGFWFSQDIYAAGPANLALAGVVAMATSVPLFISAGNNKKKARSMSANLQMQKSPTVQHGGF